MEKKIHKHKLDALIHLERGYWESGETFYLNPAIYSAKAISKDVYGNEYYWSGFRNLVSAILSELAPNADNETIYNAFKVLGWEVVIE